MTTDARRVKSVKAEDIVKARLQFLIVVFLLVIFVVLASAAPVAAGMAWAG